MFVTRGVQTGVANGLAMTVVSVEADVASGLPQCTIVGLPDTAVQEARERVRSAIRNSDFPFPRTRLIINLAPASEKKSGSGFDLAIALAILRAQEVIPPPDSDTLMIGELGLDGRLMKVRGVLGLLLSAPRLIKRVIVPVDNSAEAALQGEIEVLPAASLRQVVEHCTGSRRLSALPATGDATVVAPCETDFSDIRGQQQAKRALEIAAAGGHNVLLTGPPGAGKTLLARAAAGILPPLSRPELLEVASLHSYAGLLRTDVLSVRPFRAPHHTSSVAAIVGGGHDPRPGEISLAHRGILFLDELPEFPRAVLEALRQPLEEGTVQISRAEGHVTYPARFLFIGARNPCPCGYAGSAARACQCAAGQLLKYQKRLSGPLLDRIDLHCSVQAVPIDELRRSVTGEDSAAVRQRVSTARERQYRRFGGPRLNSTLTVREIERWVPLNRETSRLLEQAVERLQLSARSYFRMRKLSRTIADLAGIEAVAPEHVAEALQFRERSVSA